DGAGFAERVRAIELGLRGGLEQAREFAGVADVRVLGAIGVVQLEREVDLAKATAAALQHGVWLRPFRDLIYAMPPYTIEPDELAEVTEAMLAAARAGQVRRAGSGRGGRLPGPAAR